MKRFNLFSGITILAFKLEANFSTNLGAGFISVPTAIALLIFTISCIEEFKSSFFDDLKEIKLPLISITA